MAEPAFSPSLDIQQKPDTDFLWTAFSQEAFRRLCEAVRPLIEEDRKKYFEVSVPPFGVSFDEIDEHAQGAVASYIYPLTYSLASFQREHGWEALFDPASVVAVATDYHGRCSGRRGRYQELDAPT